MGRKAKAKYSDSDDSASMFINALRLSFIDFF